MIHLIQKEELLRIIRQRQPHTLIEVSAGESYGRSHLPGAVHMTGSEITSRLLPNRPGPIILYSEAPGSQEAIRAARFLEASGYPNVCHYPGGKDDWKLARYPTVSDIYRAHKHPYLGTA